MSCRCGFVGLVGLPNVGKSSFLNAVLKENLSIVSSKPQTTRKTFRGIWTQGNRQLVFLDAPGFVQGEAGMFAFLNKEFQRVLKDVDSVLLVVANDQKPSVRFEKLLEGLKKSRKPWDLIVTKADQPRSSFVEGFLKDAGRQCGRFLAVNSLRLDEAAAVGFLSSVADGFPSQRQFFYDPEEISPMNLRDLAGEWLREACFQVLDQEIPYGLAVDVRSFKEDEDMVRIHATIVVERENHKSIVIGQKGHKLRHIGQMARKKMESVLEQKVFLQTHVSLKKNWQKKPVHMKEFGYV